MKTHLDLIPYNLYFQWDVRGLELVTAWRDKNSARQAISWAVGVLRSTGMVVRVQEWRNNAYWGYFEVVLRFDGAEPEQVVDALLYPPSSNRGVTKNE